jgi:heme-degrading monooxygenase HmoA
MIARLWSARTTPALSRSYVDYFRKNVQPELCNVSGFAGATLITRSVPGAIEILVTTFWQSFAAIEGFAGSDREAAVVAPEAAALLTDYDRRVRHYDVVISAFSTYKSL